MTNMTAAPYFDDPGLQETLTAFQEENWSDGLSKLDALMEKYPFEHDLRQLRQEMVLKSRIDEYEIEELEQARRKRTQQLLVRIGVAVLFILVILLGSTTYAGVIQRELSKAQNLVQQEYSRIELSIKLRNAQNLIEAGRPEEAIVLLEEIRSVDPDYESLDEFIAQAQERLTLEGRYEAATALIEAEEWEDALVLLNDIDAEAPLYKNVPLLIEDAERYLILVEALVLADEAYAAENWSVAVERYEAVRIADATFEPDRVEDRLFNSYINAAQVVLDNPEAELEEMAVAEAYFRGALSLRPQNTDVLRIWNRARDTVRARLVNRYLEEAEAALVNNEDSEAALQTAGFYLDKARALEPGNEAIAQQADFVGRYLRALTDFRSSLWDLVITNLEYIYSFDRDYASGTARQTLYDVRIIRGDNYLSTGDFELALDDYRRAVELGLDMPDGGSLSTFEAQLKVAFALGLLFDYEGAVLMYQTAVETGGLRSREDTDPAVISSLDAAEAFALDGQFRFAYTRYRDLFNQNQLVYSQYVIHVVGEGDYLSKLANQYNSTIQAIARANDLADPNRVIIGQELIIPIFPDEG
ncbi:MAG TPA: LysM peptidoglycan-binding domain-containing protein [Anaerolineales bacterium]|nr:LysM peptidoglycan-binding domain-containing protein [Anaerolineales bacterium]